MISLCDANNYYVSVQRVFQPSLAGRPVVVLSGNDGNIISRSEEAKALGYKMGDAWHLNRDRLAKDGVHVFSSNYALYADMSARVMETLGEFGQALENYSIDESFLELPDDCDLVATGVQIRQAVLRRTGIPVSVGIGPTKVLAKLANRISKKDRSKGVYLMPTGEGRRALLHSVATGDIWGIGSQQEAKLKAAGITTAGDLAALSDTAARALLTVTGARIVAELNGVKCLELETIQASRQSICRAKSFGVGLSDREEMIEPLSCHVSGIAEKLREQGSVCGHMRVFIETNSFQATSPQYRNMAGCDLPTPSNFTPDLLAVAIRLLNQIWRPGFRFKKVGVMALELSSESETQMTFSSICTEGAARRRSLMRAVDKLNGTMGRNTVRYASSGDVSPVWQMRQAMRSPRFTTRFDELPVATAR